MTLLGRLSVVGAGRPGLPVGEDLLRRSAVERTLPVVCRNLGRPCDLERTILARQILAAHQAREILSRVPALPLKGLHLAHHIYPSPGLRDMGDIDLLVRPRDLRAADEALRALGYAAAADPASMGEGTLNAVSYSRAEGMPVHLHWSVTNASLPHFMYRIDAEEIWRDAQDGRMAPHHLVVTLCEHALKHSWEHLIHLTDIELAARKSDPGEVAGAARRWGLELAVHFAHLLIGELMEVATPALKLARAPSLGPEGRILLGMARRRRWSGLSALGFLSMARGWADKARFVRQALAPSAETSGGYRSRSMGRRVGRACRMIWSGITSRAPAR